MATTMKPLRRRKWRSSKDFFAKQKMVNSHGFADGLVDVDIVVGYNH